jgi:hypothetical protein
MSIILGRYRAGAGSHNGDVRVEAVMEPGPREER